MVVRAEASAGRSLRYYRLSTRSGWLVLACLSLVLAPSIDSLLRYKEVFRFADLVVLRPPPACVLY